ncbi:MAG: hypothetical protein IBX72_14755 [Nitrospirae bacterium]|nr:hypothetical protein [Nitrospirota bacterium]
MGEAILWAETKFGELLKKILDFHSSGRGTMKRKDLPEGITKKQSHEAQQLAKNPEILHIHAKFAQRIRK